MIKIQPSTVELYNRFKTVDGGFTTDTRKIERNDIFFALKGENFNGNAYANQALSLGASLVVVDETTDTPGEQTFHVHDVLTTMQELALHHRRQFKSPFVAVAGSNGKTTTKELLTACLSTGFKVHATKGNYNNHIGVPITLLEMQPDSNMAIIEIGTNSFGEIAFLCQLLEPDYGLITNIGKEHLEGFGDLEGVAREESELYNYLQLNKGFAFVNSDDVYLRSMSKRLQQFESYGFEAGANQLFKMVETIPELNISNGNSTFKCKLQGKHNAQNMAAAITVSRYFGLTDQQIATGLNGYIPSNNRSEWRTLGSNSFLLDAYNANPSSMAAAIETFKQLDQPNKLMLLGDMFELGQTSEAEHAEIAQMAQQCHGTEVIFCGPEFSKAAGRWHGTTLQNIEELIAHLKSRKFDNAWFLIKGSRGMKMERALEAFG